MENITNDSTIQACSNVLGSQVENKPNLDTSKITLVADVAPNHNRISEIVKYKDCTNSTAQTIYTTPTDRDFYLTSASLSSIKDVTSTSVRSSIIATIKGEAQRILNIAGITLTVQDQTTSISYSAPIKIDRGTNIQVTASTNVANVTSSAVICGFLTDKINY